MILGDGVTGVALTTLSFLTGTVDMFYPLLRVYFLLLLLLLLLDVTRIGSMVWIGMMILGAFLD